MSRPIDLCFGGEQRVIAAYWVDGTVIDPGPASCVERLLAQLPGEPTAVLLTHIHLDHAGACGTLCSLFPELRVYVHERGAPHLVDPTRLLASAERLYGPGLGVLFGRVEPVPEERIVALAGGERVDRFDVDYAPGHAWHHVIYHDRLTGTAYVGDVAGVRIPPDDHVVAPTPPPEIDLERWFETLDQLAARAPAALALTHFGVVEAPAVGDHLARVRASLAELAELARRRSREAFERALRERLRRVLRPETLVRLEKAAPLDHLYLGLERYWRKRAEVKESRP